MFLIQGLSLRGLTLKMLLMMSEMTFVSCTKWRNLNDRGGHQVRYKHCPARMIPNHNCA